MENMGWKKKKEISIKKQRELFIALTPDEKVVTQILQQPGTSSYRRTFLKKQT